MWKTKRCKEYSKNVHKNMPPTSVRNSSPPAAPLFNDVHTNHPTTGIHNKGIAHHAVRVKNSKTIFSKNLGLSLLIIG